ncbi:hypothetical protein BX616_005473 [Lobosporangium transversale]|nr:hypothetical protein BX616_005473 [Lobosporangium transversale]
MQGSHTKTIVEDQPLLSSPAILIQDDYTQNNSKLHNEIHGRSIFETPSVPTASTEANNSLSTGHLNGNSNKQENGSEICDLVVVVRDFAYPKSHSYHFGNYPPEPTHEDFDDDDDDYDDYDRADHKDSRGQDSSSESSWATSVPSSLQKDQSQQPQGYARGLYDFDAENSSELTFKEGDYLWIHCRQYPGWLLGELDSGAQGLVPENYVQMV